VFWQTSMRISAVVAACSLAICTFALVTRARPLRNPIELVAAVASPYASLLAFAVLAASALQRRMLLSAAAFALVMVTLAVQVHWHYLGRPSSHVAGEVIRVLSANLRKGQADARFVADLANASADIVAVSELTPDELQRLVDAGIGESFPHSLLRPEPGAGGIGLWSRFVLTGVEPPDRDEITVVAARVRVPGVQLDPIAVSLHITSPINAQSGYFRRWQRGITDAQAKLDYFAELAGQAPVIVAGDFNSTPDMRQFRDLLSNGYRDAVEQAGAGWSPTFPSGSWFPPMITIDHVLTRNATATSVRTVYVPGSDHRAVVTAVRLSEET